MMKKIFYVITALVMAITLATCNKNNDNLNDIDTTTSANEYITTDENSGFENTHINPYLSITARRLNPDFEDYVWDEVYYALDLVTNELEEICVLPHFSGYTAGVFSGKENAVYFSMREQERSNDRICRYDIQSGEIDFIENENLSYNDIVKLDPNTLLVIASTREHTITPALFDLYDKKFTYMADVNNEKFDLYTAGGYRLNYNYLFDTFPWLFFKSEERDSDSYHMGDEPIDYNFVLVSTNLEKNSEVFTEQFMNTHEVKFLTQLSENEVLVKFIETTYDDLAAEFVVEDIYYLLTFDGENSSFVQIDNPFPKADMVTQAMTFDGGKTYYCIGYYALNGVNYSESMFIYNCETDEITTILSESDNILSVANFRSVG